MKGLLESQFLSWVMVRDKAMKDVKVDDKVWALICYGWLFVVVEQPSPFQNEVKKLF